MNSSQYLALTSWALEPGPCFLLACAAAIYIRGWLRIRRLYRSEHDVQRLVAFLAGLATVFVATESPLDAFDYLYLSAHMTQHLLLMMIAPPLILLGHPTVPVLRGLPKNVVKEALAPFLHWDLLKRVFRFLTTPAVAWLLFAISTIGWHVPAAYELALASPFWHAVEHTSFFWTGILFWWPIVRPIRGRSKWPEWIGIPYLLFADLVNTALSAFFVFSGRLLYPSYSTVQMAGLDARNDQVLAGAIMWVPGSLIYLVPAIVLAMRVLSGPRQDRRSRGELVRRQRANVSLKRLHAPAWRRAAQSAMLLAAVAIVSDGFAGPQIAPVNMAGVLPWIHWRALSIVALLVVGNLFCMACPFTLVRDWGRKFLPAATRWPRALRNKWVPAALFVIFLWAYEAFSLWDSPAATAWIILGYFAAALAVDGLFRGASFCKYVCPIGQFHFVASLISPKEVAVRKQTICESCKTHDCIRGNKHARGCELYLFQPKKAGNL
ncbi:MAG: cytochrome c oxidase assembly protein, partial [Acidobacteriaceae bacterium]|nr:cytochrome c oxidase assembly protein [Acidobacteriaceae bacterium]